MNEQTNKRGSAVLLLPDGATQGCLSLTHLFTLSRTHAVTQAMRAFKRVCYTQPLERTCVDWLTAQVNEKVEKHVSVRCCPIQQRHADIMRQCTVRNAEMLRHQLCQTLSCSLPTIHSRSSGSATHGMWENTTYASGPRLWTAHLSIDKCTCIAITSAHALCELCRHVEAQIQDGTCRSEEAGPDMMQEGMGGQPGPPSLPHHLPGQQHPSNSESQAGQAHVPHPQAQPIRQVRPCITLFMYLLVELLFSTTDNQDTKHMSLVSGSCIYNPWLAWCV